MLAGQSRGSESRYAIDLYLKQRGDAKFRTVDDLYATKSFAGENDWLRTSLGARAETLDTPDQASPMMLLFCRGEQRAGSKVTQGGRPSH